MISYDLESQGCLWVFLSRNLTRAMLKEIYYAVRRRMQPTMQSARTAVGGCRCLQHYHAFHSSAPAKITTNQQRVCLLQVFTGAHNFHQIAPIIILLGLATSIIVISIVNILPGPRIRPVEALLIGFTSRFLGPNLCRSQYPPACPI